MAFSQSTFHSKNLMARHSWVGRNFKRRAGDGGCNCLGHFWETLRVEVVLIVGVFSVILEWKKHLID